MSVFVSNVRLLVSMFRNIIYIYIIKWDFDFQLRVADSSESKC